MSSVRSCRDGRRAAERTAKQAVMATCVYRKLDSAIMVVKAAEDRLRCDGADALNRAMKRGVLVQRSMSPQLIIIGGICAEDPAQVRFTEHDHVVQRQCSNCRRFANESPGPNANKRHQSSSDSSQFIPR